MEAFVSEASVVSLPEKPQPSTVNKLSDFPGFVSGLLALSQDGYHAASISELMAALQNPSAELTEEHESILPILLNNTFLAALEPIAANHPNLLITNLVETFLQTESKKIIPVSLQHIANGYRTSFLLTGYSGGILKSVQPVDAIKVIDMTIPGIAQVEENTETHTLIINSINPGTTEFLVRVTLNGADHILSIPVEVKGKFIDRSEQDFAEILTRETLLGDSDVMKMIKTCSVSERPKIVAAIEQLKQGQLTGLEIIAGLESISVFQQNLLLLNVPKVGKALTEAIAASVTHQAMDGRDFDDNLQRMEKYGVDMENPANTTFSLEGSRTANRYVFLALNGYLAPEHLAQLSREPDQAATAEIFADSSIAHALVLLLSEQKTKPTARKRNLEVTIPHLTDRPEIATVIISVRNSQGQFVATKHIAATDNPTIIFQGMANKKNLLITATAKTRDGQKLKYPLLTVAKAV
jgi:hypothetical protein